MMKVAKRLLVTLSSLAGLVIAGGAFWKI